MDFLICIYIYLFVYFIYLFYLFVYLFILGGGGGGRLLIYLSLHCHHQNDSCIKMGSDESHFNVSLIVWNKVTRQCPQTTTFEEKGQPKRNRTDVPLLTSLTPYR